jgi:hypothetical protein
MRIGQTLITYCFLKNKVEPVGRVELPTS